VGWSPDGKQVLTGSLDGTVRMWIANNRLVMAELTRRVCHVFTDDAIRIEIPAWPGCASKLAAVEVDLKVYDALRSGR
jgi:WD40 repeat protein